MTPVQVNPERLKPYLPYVIADGTIPNLPNHYRGKVRDNYDLPNGQRIIITSDRLSAFDRILTTIPLKGQALTQIARFWFDATRDICPNHVIDYPDPNVVVSKRLSIMPVEIVVRDYMTGSTGTSIWPMYKAGHRSMYGIQFPDGMKENQKLPETIITPTTKAFDAGHDEPLSPADIVARNLLTQAQWDEVSKLALALFDRGRRIAKDRGLILVDTKYEFGFDENGNIILADEIHTPDSSRYWFLDTYDERFQSGQKPQSFDKDFVRTWVASRCDPYKNPIPEIPEDIRLQAGAIYIGAFEKITGQPFEWPDASVPVIERVQKALRSILL
jgi:phosphoribosylaminoimidazole-succinocarboxamide synthase